MEYTNPKIPEGINTSREHPLKEFAILTFGVFGVIALAVFILSMLAEELAPYVPFSVEQQLIPDNFAVTGVDSKASTYLQGLSDQLAQHLDLPEDMQFIIHYSEEPVENAFATIGGHIYIYQGLIDLLPNENALSMVIAHEMAHVYHRHPIIAMGRGVVIGLLLTAISGLSSDSFVGQIVTDAGVITLLTFTRDQEQEADNTALELLAAHYGHVGGADELFKAFHKLEDDDPMSTPQFLSTHPLSESRIDSIHTRAKNNGWDMHGETTALPEFFRQ